MNLASGRQRLAAQVRVSQHRRIESLQQNRRGAVSEILKRADGQLPIAVHSDDFPIENSIDRQRFERARDIRETAREVPIVS
jgi:hypothetical protein